MGNAKGAMFQDARAKKGSERARGGCIVGERDRRIWVRVGERLKCLVCTESVTNKEYQAFSGSFLRLYTVLAHAMNNRTCKVGGETTPYVQQMEHHRYQQEPIATELRHCKRV